MHTLNLHIVQTAILYTLRHTRTARYSELLRASGVDNDVFKSHLRRLVQEKMIEKTDEDVYRLTSAGKEFANNLDRPTRTVQKQPKLSLLLVVKRGGDENQEYLFQQRFRQPFYNYWGCISGPVKWGQDFAQAASAELLKQTGMRATFSVIAFRRTTDHTKTGEILEDKLFVILQAMNYTGGVSNTWSGGHNAWMNLENLKQQPLYFSDTEEILSSPNTGTSFSTSSHYYDNVTQY